MATPLAIGYLAPRRRNPPAAAASRPAARDALSDRPPIPRGVIRWSDEDLPVGAGDPAMAIDGPPPFAPLRATAPRSPWRERLETALFGVLMAALLGASSLAVIGGAQAIVAAELSPAAGAAIAGRVPVVETRVLSTDRIVDTASRSPAGIVSQVGG